MRLKLPYVRVTISSVSGMRVKQVPHGEARTLPPVFGAMIVMLDSSETLYLFIRVEYQRPLVAR